MIACCGKKRECLVTLDEIIRGTKKSEWTRETDLKIVALKELWVRYTYLLLKEKGQPMCSECFYFTKDLMKKCELLEKEASK